jgi:hypothetical protein
VRPRVQTIGQFEGRSSAAASFDLSLQTIRRQNEREGYSAGTADVPDERSAGRSMSACIGRAHITSHAQTSPRRRAVAAIAMIKTLARRSESSAVLGWQTELPAEHLR